jgi:hypothetical protein
MLKAFLCFSGTRRRTRVGFAAEPKWSEQASERVSRTPAPALLVFLVSYLAVTSAFCQNAFLASGTFGCRPRRPPNSGICL